MEGEFFMFLVIGATGNLGSEICRNLRADLKPVRGLVRSTSDPNKVQNLKNLGVQTVIGDLKDTTSLKQACAGVTAVISTASSLMSHQPNDNFTTVDLEGHKNLIDAAKNTGVSQFVYISFSSRHTTDCPLTNAKRQVEQYLKSSGITYTIIRPAAFMEQWLSPTTGFDVPHARATILGTGQNKISFISIKDVARFVNLSIGNPKSKNTMIELGGPKSISYMEAVDLFQNISGRQFMIQKLTEDSLISQKNVTSDPFQQSIIGYRLDLTKGDEVDMRDTLNNYPISLTTVQDYATHILTRTGWW